MIMSESIGLPERRSVEILEREDCRSWISWPIWSFLMDKGAVALLLEALAELERPRPRPLKLENRPPRPL